MEGPGSATEAWLTTLWIVVAGRYAGAELASKAAPVCSGTSIPQAVRLKTTIRRRLPSLSLQRRSGRSGSAPPISKLQHVMHAAHSCE